MRRKLFPFAIKSDGFSMLEMLIALALFGLVLTMSMKMFSSNTQQIKGVKEAESILNFREMVSRFYFNNANALLQAMHDGTDKDKYCVIAPTGYNNSTGEFSGGISTFNNSTKTCAFDVVVLKYKGMWPFDVPNSTQPRWIVIFKREYDNSTIPPTPKDSASALIVHGHGNANYVTNSSGKTTEHLLAVADVLGEFGGFVKAMNCNSTHACGSAWSAQLSDYDAQPK